MDYQAIPEMTPAQVEEVIVRNNPDEMLIAVLSAALYADDGLWAANVCLRLSNHPDETVRGNAILGFGHIARLHQQLPESRAKPIIERGLQDSSLYVRGQAQAAADDVECFLKWKIRLQS